MANRRTYRRWLPRVAIVGAVVVMVTAAIKIGDSLFEPPETKAEAAQELGQALLYYENWDGTPYVVFELDGRIHFDRLIADPVSIEWPPSPQWQWSGLWSYLPETGDPASVAVSDVPVPNVLFGQINDPSIAAIALGGDETSETWPVLEPAFAVQLPDEASVPVTVDFLDAEGHVVWTAEVQDG